MPTKPAEPQAPSAAKYTPGPWEASIYSEEEHDPWHVEIETPDVLTNEDRATAQANARAKTQISSLCRELLGDEIVEAERVLREAGVL